MSGEHTHTHSGDSHQHGHGHGHGHEHHGHSHEHGHSHGPEHAADYFTTASTTWDEKPGMRELSEQVFKSLAAKVPLNKQMEVLDFGCGSGLLTMQLVDKVASVMALDPSQGMIDVVNRKLQEKGVHNVTTVCKELQHSTDVHDRRFDLIVSSMVLHHVEHAQATITLLSTLLRTDGVLMICDLLKTADGVDHFHSAHALKHGGVFHQGGFTEDSMKAMFAKAGLCDVKCQVDIEQKKLGDDQQERTFQVLTTWGRLDRDCGRMAAVDIKDATPTL